MLTLPSLLSRLRLQDRIWIVPLDVTLGTFPTHLPWGGEPGDRCCWVEEALCRAGGRASHMHTHTRGISAQSLLRTGKSSLPPVLT